MFTGIVQGMAVVHSHEHKDGASRLSIVLPDDLTAGIEEGASIAIDGTCLTVTAQQGAEVCFDLIGETLQLTTLGELVSGDEVNVERAAKVGDEIGGHEMSGHISTTASIVAVDHPGANHVISMEIDSIWMRYIIAKGFIGIDGCSLTVADADPEGSFSVWLIPETLQRTCFGHKGVGDVVNIEIDARTQAIVDTISRNLEATS